MNRVCIFLKFFCMFCLVQMLSAQTQNPQALLDLRNQIRKERFDLIVPQTMRNNNIDIWIHVIKKNDLLDLGANEGYCVFTDRGGDRIERAIFNYNYLEDDPAASFLETYDIAGGEVPEPSSTRSRFHGLREFIAERDPKRIGVNYSKKLALADGISYTEYLELVNELGDTYAKRMVSTDNLIIDFLSRRVVSEIVLFGQLTQMCAENLEREFAKIEPGITALIDIPGNVFVRHPDGSENNSDDYVLQKGDMLVVGLGKSVKTFDAAIMEFGYVLREGETELPPEVKKIWEHSLNIRDILRKNIKVGRSAGETLELLIRNLEEAEYVYIDKDKYDKNADPLKTQVHLDLHAMGRGMDIPRISPLSADWALDLVIPLYHTFVFEYMVHMPVPEWGKGKHLYLNFHDSVIVTERGVEFPYPPVQRIRTIK